MPTDSETTDGKRIALVGCGSAKRDEPRPAKHLYSSGYFTLKRRYAEQHCDDWTILSAKHRLLDPDREIAPYDASLTPDADSYVGEEAVEQWTSETAAELHSYLETFTNPPTIVILAGEDYGGRLEPALRQVEADVEWPFRRDELGGLHDQMAWLSEETSAV
jgi:hypothetical protein